jgi:hypothetical protein
MARKPGGVGAALVPEVVRRRLQGDGPTAIAKALGCSPQAVHDTLQRPEVIEEIRQAHAEMKARAQGALVGLLEEATRVHAAMLRDEDQPPAVRAKLIEMAYDRTGLVRGAELTVRHEALTDDDVLAELAEALGESAVAAEDEIQ